MREAQYLCITIAPFADTTVNLQTPWKCSRAPGQAAKGRAGETANRLEAAALVLLGLCDNKPVLQLLADCRSDLLAASQSLR